MSVARWRACGAPLLPSPTPAFLDLPPPVGWPNKDLLTAGDHRPTTPFISINGQYINIQSIMYCQQQPVFRVWAARRLRYIMSYLRHVQTVPCLKDIVIIIFPDMCKKWRQILVAMDRQDSRRPASFSVGRPPPCIVEVSDFSLALVVVSKAFWQR